MYPARDMKGRSVLFYIRHPWRFLKKLIPQSFWGRSLLIVITPVVFIQLISGYVFFHRYWENTTKSLAHGIAGDMDLSMHLLQDHWNDSAVLINQVFRSTGMQIKIVKEKFHDIPAYKPFSFQSRFERALRKKLKFPYRLKMDARVTRVWVKGAVGVVQFRFSTKRIFIHKTPLWLLWSLGASCFFCFLASFFMRRQLYSLRHLVLISQGLSRGKTLQNYKIRGPTEIRHIIQMFQLMERKLLEQIQERTTFLAGVSHDLRTPLTRIRLQLALLPASQEHQDLTSDVDQMIHMVEEYLTFLSQEESTQPQELQIRPFCQILLKYFEPLSKKVTLDIPDHLVMTTSASLLRRCLQNLLENALRYAKTQVVISAVCSDQSVTFIVDDDGPGIPSASYADVFQPFLRLDPARNLQVGGAGLGLTIVKKLTQHMKGSVSLENSPLGGLRVFLQIPFFESNNSNSS